MEYMKLTEAEKARHPSIHCTGSVRGMKKLGYWGQHDHIVRCGNAVCPAVAEAMVRANLKECPKRRIHSMDALYEAMTS